MSAVGMLVDQWPALGTDSTTQMNYLLIQELNARQQPVIVLKPLKTGTESGIQLARRAALDNMSFVKTAVLLPSRDKASRHFFSLPQALQWNPELWFWQIGCKDSLISSVRDHEISIVFTYGDCGIAWLASHLEPRKRRIVLGDPPDQPFVFRQARPFRGSFRFLDPRWWLRWLLILHLRRNYSELTDKLKTFECISSLYAEMLSNRGLHARYCRSAVVPPPESVHRKADGPLRLVLIGNQAATANRQGTWVLASQIIPHLKELLLSGAIEIRIIGGELECISKHDRRRLEASHVQLAGYVDDLEAEFLFADALLIPVTIPLGVRIRTIEGWSRGLPTIGHVSISDGLPEAVHGLNCLLGADPLNIARNIVALEGDRDLLTKLSIESLATYESIFAKRASSIAEQLMSAKD